MKMGQVLWYAVDNNERSGYGKRIERCKLKPVLLDYITDDDIKRLLNGESRKKIKQEIEVRLFNNSFKQGGVLNNRPKFEFYQFINSPDSKFNL